MADKKLKSKSDKSQTDKKSAKSSKATKAVKKVKRTIAKGRIYLSTTYNNTSICILKFWNYGI
jgi:ribosomal protein S11